MTRRSRDIWLVTLVGLATFLSCFCDDALRYKDESPVVHDILVGPLNDATVAGNSVILKCEGTDGSRIQWTEYATGSENGELISDGENILPGHPNASRYEILYDGANGYDLHIASTVLGDGGKYECSDSSGPAAFAQLIMMLSHSTESDPVCVTTIPVNGDVVESRYYTIECLVDYRADSTNIAPIMTWTGPRPFEVDSSTTDTTVWSRVGFRATTSMNGRQFSCKTNFTTDGFNQTDSATNAPTYQHAYSSVILRVNFSPYAGVTYIRWGRTVCEATADTVYRGWAVGNFQISTSYQSGGVGDYTCAPASMEWGTAFSGYHNTGSRVSGVEYYLSNANNPFSLVNNRNQSLNGYDAPCVTCLTNRTTHLMIPGARNCPTGWTTEYRGYLASGYYASDIATGQICLDDAPEVISLTQGDGPYYPVFSVVEVDCSYIAQPCTPGYEMACVVCTK